MRQIFTRHLLGWSVQYVIFASCYEMQIIYSFWLHEVFAWEYIYMWPQFSPCDGNHFNYWTYKSLIWSDTYMSVFQIFWHHIRNKWQWFGCTSISTQCRACCAAIANEKKMKKKAKKKKSAVWVKTGKKHIWLL